ncbi:nuclear exosome regulator NRDE2 [Arctopsyche grandis]|uniref:nuclear exosome regulator NRDE2 n=1 Tax=Arctopsyche grandis TaxID=121162 RepID=UPI00406D82D7
MALFPAYSDNSESVLQIDGDLNTKIVAKSSIVETHVLDSSDEAELLKSDNSVELISDDHKTSKRKTEKHKKKKKSKNKDKDKDKLKEKLEKKLDDKYLRNSTEDFYIDKRIDYGNLRVSTLYNPARPQYDRKKKLLGICAYSNPKKRKRGADRYYNTKIIDQSQNIDKTQPKSSKKRSHKQNEDFIEIEDSGISWGDERIDKDLVEKTTNFNKYLNDNPYDVDMWLQFVKFQEDRLAFDVFNHRVASKATAKNLCCSKQLSILDAALKHNFNSMELLCKKVKLSEQSMANDQYLSMLKQLIGTPDLQLGLLNRAWLWYVDAVQCSMALSSVSSVKEIYAAALKALTKAMKEKYAVSHVDITYRLGLFLRQAGLWEQLWMLIKMNIEINLAATNTEGSCNFESLVTQVNDKDLIDEENKIISSGLPMHEIWSRIELLRSKLQWLPSTIESDDPQRIVFSTDFADFIKPVSQKANMFAMTVNILRLLKIPLLPATHETTVCMKGNGYLIEWENDNIETCLPFLYTIISSLERIDTLKLKILTNIVKDFAEEPNYLSATNQYFKFINNIMMQCSRWFDGDEQTAILLWWIRLLRTLLTMISLDSSDVTEMQKIIANFRKFIKDVLKLHRDNVCIYKEFSIFEAHFSGFEKGLVIVEACLLALPHNRSLSRVHLCRSIVEMILEKNFRTDESISKATSILVALSSDEAINQQVNESSLNVALGKYMEYTDTSLWEVSNFDREILLTEYMMPDMKSDWICCHGWLIYLTQPFQSLKQFYNKIMIATHVEKLDRNSLDAKRKTQLRENFLQWYISIIRSDIRVHSEIARDKLIQKVLQQGIEEFPFNGAIVWYYVDWCGSNSIGRLHSVKLFKEDDLSQMFALAFVVENFSQLYMKYDPSYVDLWQPGHGNRLLNVLQTISSHSGLRKCALIWRMLIEFVSCHTQESAAIAKKFLYQALDECPWNKGLYRTGCIRIPSEFSELVDIMVEKQIRLHAMPEELQLL